MPVLNRFPPCFENPIVARDALKSRNKIFTVENVKIRLCQEYHRFEMRAGKSSKDFWCIVLVNICTEFVQIKFAGEGSIRA